MTNLKIFIFFEFFSENVLKSLLGGRETTRKKYRIVFEKVGKVESTANSPIHIDRWMDGRAGKVEKNHVFSKYLKNYSIFFVGCFASLENSFEDIF